jgi:hypothetical protein
MQALQTMFFAIMTLLPYVLVGQVMARSLAAGGQPVGPLTYITAGAGAWLLWFYGLVGLGQLPVNLGLYVFWGVVITASVVWHRHLFSRQQEHVWTGFLLGGVLLLPLWPGLANQDLFQALDVGFTLKSLVQVLAFNQVPTGAEVFAQGAQQLAHMPAGWAWLLPGQILAGQVLEATGPVLNGMLLLAIAGAMAAGAGVQTRWSNLLLVVAGSLVGMVLLNPFFSAQLVTSALPDLLLAGGLLVLALPLMLPRPLPRGVALLPLALTAALVATVHPDTWPLLFALAVLWGIRDVTVEKPTQLMLKIFGWGVLVGTPLTAVFLWQAFAGYAAGPEYPAPHLLAFGGQRIGAFGLALGAWGVLLWRLARSGRWGGPRLFYLSQSAWLVAATLALIGALYGEDPWRVLVWLQCIMLLPYWRWAMILYQRSFLRSVAFRAPWVAGGSLALASMGVLYSTENRWWLTVPPAVRHVQQVGEALPRHRLAGETIAVLEAHPGPRANLDRALGYAVVIKGADLSFRAADRSRAAFHYALRRDGVDYLWIHSPQDAVRDMFRRPLDADKSYLFEVMARRFSLVEIYPHLNYVGSGWR